ncbi:PDGLE domain-containing protein [Paraconexibacter sp.]|uniref:PDGLE domain-containing protein n=1 Tax=Paraconexibacter sp. TaxID=2949640 RepID=UPI00356B0C6F
MTGRRGLLVLLVAAVAALAAFASPFAASSPDGLSAVARDHGFAADRSMAAARRDAPFSDYAVPGVGGDRTSKGLSGLIGVTLVFGAAAGTGLALRRRHRGAA